MDFSNYLNFFMWAFNLKNGDVAKCLYVDPSLISKWRTGRRIPKSDSIYQISQALVSLCTTDSTRLRLCNFLGIPYSRQLFLDNPDQVVQNLYAFMDPASNESLLSSSPLSAVPGMEAAQEEMQMFLGEEGYRKCIIGLLNTAIARGSPFHVYLLTNDTVDWLLGDPAFFQEWESTIRRCEIAVASFQLIYHQSHNVVKGRSYVRAWAPLKSLSNFQIYNLAIRQDTHRMFNHTMMIIPHVGACCGLNLNHSQNRYMTLHRNEQVLRKMEQDFAFLLTRCIRTTESQVLDYTQMAAKFQLDSALDNCRDIEIYASHLPIFALPEETLRTMLERTTLSKNNIIAYLAAHRQVQQLFDSYIRQRFNFEMLVYLPPDLELRHLEDTVLPHSMMYFGQELVYTREDARAHIDAVLTLLRQERDFHLFILDYSLYPADVFIGYNGFLMEYESNGHNGVSFSYQQNYLNDVLSYISSSIRKTNHEKYAREHSITRLLQLKGEES